MTEPQTSASPERVFFSSIPPSVYIVAALAAVLHLAPLWHAQSTTPAGWEFTGNLSNSPDYMQYREWARVSQSAGPIVPNTMTPEPNQPHLPVFFYWGIGQVSELTGVRPEYVFEYAGSILAFLFVVLLFLTVRHFLPSRYATWWVFLIILLGGGLTSHLEWLARRPTGFASLNRLLAPVENHLTLDNMRFAYVYRALLDSHFLVVYLFTVLSLLAVYFALTRPSTRRWLVAALLIAATTLLHLYEGLLLLAIIGSTALLLWTTSRMERPSSVRLTVFGGGAAALTLVALFVLQRRSGLPITEWRAPEIFLSNVLLGYPVGWAVLLGGAFTLRRTLDRERLFLLSWVLGCSVMLLSSPYYPFADRGATTLQIPLYILAGVIFFQDGRKVPAWGALVVIVALGFSLPWSLSHFWRASDFDPDMPSMYLDDEHRRTLEVLDRTAGEGDVLLAEYFDYRWLVPSFRGRGFHPHFFLTVDFEERRRQAQAFYTELGAADRARFLADQGIGFVWIDRDDYDPQEIAPTPGLIELDRGSHGTLFRFDPAVWARAGSSP